MNQVTGSVSEGVSEKVVDEISTELTKQDGKQESSQDDTQDRALECEQQEPIKQDGSLTEHKNQMAQILAQTEKVNKQLTYFHKHKLFKVYNSIPQLLWFNLLKGAAFGLGSVLGATVVLSALVYLLAQIEFIPFIGEWISAILEVVRTETPD